MKFVMHQFYSCNSKEKEIVHFIVCETSFKVQTDVNITVFHFLNKIMDI